MAAPETAPIQAMDELVHGDSRNSYHITVRDQAMAIRDYVLSLPEAGAVCLRARRRTAE